MEEAAIVIDNIKHLNLDHTTEAILKIEEICQIEEDEGSESDAKYVQINHIPNTNSFEIQQTNLDYSIDIENKIMDTEGKQTLDLLQDA